ncbi:DUF3945 domain-containing protein [Bacteroides xylanisolvens]|jgi:hypothetical protein|uniref:DUF3945 domain-containing protein n=2 Tax=Bacteroides xylanisolvens TaxID=371601 RepID=A0A7J5PWI3_9BACE|nr:DUF3945 domain-containing protein [Bacteroides xylanisolvens]KAB6147367.1 DUF3945 domain-containing protein [Bacteroides xylanisolvens]
MAQEKEVKEKPKRTRKTQKSAKEKPYVEQINELLFVHNKNDPQTGVQAVSGIDEKGKVQTVPADERNENSFLKFEKNSSILENFIKNFLSQLKEPTHFRLIRMTIHDYKQNKQAIRDLSQGKETDTVKEFLKRYEIRPRENREQSKNEKEKETMAKKQNPQEKAQQPVQTSQTQEQQAPRYRYNENMVNWEALEKIGVSKASLEQQGLLDSMLKGYKTNKLVPLTLTLTSAKVKLDARLSFIAMPDGQIGLGIHGIRKEPELERPYFGHIFTEEDKKNLRETGNMGRVAELNLNGGAYTPCLISIDKNTNELVAVRQENVYIPNEVKGIKLTADEINALKEGKPVYVDGMTSKNGKPFDATLQYSAERRGLEFIYPESQGFNQQSLGGVQLSPSQIKMLSEGHTILVEDMKRTDGALFSSFVTLDKVTGRPQYTRHNPENGEIYIPKEICNVQLTPEDKEALRKGQPVFLENMINRKGEEFSSFVKLDMNTGRPQYSRTPDGFSERQAPIVPAEVYGHVFTAQERANLQDGKAILVSDLKSANNKTFSSYLKVNANSGQLQYFQENPDIRRNTTRRAAQTDDMQNRQQEQKKASRQAV